MRYGRMEQVIRAAVEVEPRLTLAAEVRAVPSLAALVIDVEVVHFLAQRLDHAGVLHEVVVQRRRAALHRTEDHRIRQRARLPHADAQLRPPPRLQQSYPSQDPSRSPLHYPLSPIPSSSSARTDPSASPRTP